MIDSELLRILFETFLQGYSPKLYRVPYAK